MSPRARSPRCGRAARARSRWPWARWRASSSARCSAPGRCVRTRPALGVSAGPELSDDARSAAEAAQFQAVAVPALVADRLTGHVVTVVALPGAEVPAALTRTLADSGAVVTGPLVLASDYLDPARTRVLRDLAVQVAPQPLQDAIKAQPADTLPSAQLDTVLASS